MTNTENAAMVVLGGLALLSVGCTSAVVGAECRPGFEACDGRCVQVASDPSHCGGCGVGCGGAEACVAGRCAPAAADARLPGWGDAAVSFADAGPSSDAGPAEDAGGLVGDAGGPYGDAGASADAGVASAPDAGTLPGGCDLGERLCGDACVRVDRAPLHCGACGHACGPSEVCADGACVSGCFAPRQQCDGVCVNPQSDPDHCGACGVSCSSGVCVAGACAGPVAGHLVLIGHDYETSRPDMNRVVGNAVFLGRGATPRVLVYEGVAAAASVAGVDAAIDQVAAESGRSWDRVVVDALGAPFALAEADVLLVHAQTEGSDDDVAALARAWGGALGTFLTRGGAVVVLDGVGANRGTHRLLVDAGLIRSTGRVEVTRNVLDVVAPGDAIALGVPLRYRAERSSVRFGVSEGTVVVRDVGGPVVIHWIVLPG